MGERFANPVLAQGRVTIPSDVRESLDLEQGEYVVLDIQTIRDEE